ncbi:MAG TPA: hypothetical protein VF911_18590 [Thermoanaerobaculia bacterium]|jgi:hypothetical protein
MKSVRYIIVFTLLVLSLVPAAEAQRRRRSVRSAPRIVAPPAGQCHTFGFVRPGLKATYLSNAQGGDVTSTVTYISDSATETRTTQTVATPQGNAEGETVITGEMVGNLRAVKHVFVRTSIMAPVIGRVTTDVDIDFVPSLAVGPAGGWCVNATWLSSPSTQTITTRPSIGPPMTITNTVLANEGIVLAVGDQITVPAGTFNTVKYRGTYASASGAQVAITWVSMEHNIVVRQDTLDAGGSTTSVMQLTALQ